MTAETWESVAVPLLEHFAEREDEYAYSSSAIGTRTIAAAAGVDVVAAELELTRLFAAGYIAGRFESEGQAGASWMIRPTLTAKGAWAARKWPTDEPAEALLTIIDRRLQEASTPEERGFWQKIKDGFAGVPGNITASLAVEVVKVLSG